MDEGAGPVPARRGGREASGPGRCSPSRLPGHLHSSGAGLQGPPRTLSENQLTGPSTQAGGFRRYLLPCLQRPVGIAAVFDAQDDDFAKVFPDAIKDPISTPTRRPHPRQVIAQRLASPGRLLDQCGSEELDDSHLNRLRQFPGQCPPRRRGKDKFVGPLLAHRGSRRTASTPRMTSPRA